MHAFKNVGPTPGKLRYIFSPALTIEDMFRAFYAARENNALSFESMAEISMQHVQEFVGPPL